MKDIPKLVVNNRRVNKQCKREIYNLFTAAPLGIHGLFTELLAIQNSFHATPSLKKLDRDTVDTIIQTIKHATSLGFSGAVKPPTMHTRDRAIKLLVATAFKHGAALRHSYLRSEAECQR